MRQKCVWNLPRFVGPRKMHDAWIVHGVADIALHGIFHFGLSSKKGGYRVPSLRQKFFIARENNIQRVLVEIFCFA